jgi:hypothetical protein
MFDLLYWEVDREQEQELALSTELQALDESINQTVILIEKFFKSMRLKSWY